MIRGNDPCDGGHLTLNFHESNLLGKTNQFVDDLIFPFIGSQELTKGIIRKCMWIKEHQLERARKDEKITTRIEAVRKMRASAKSKATRKFANSPHRFKQIIGGGNYSVIVVPRVTSENRRYLPVGLFPAPTIVANSAIAIYDQPLWNMALIASRVHLVWIATVCGRLGTGFRYSNTLGWNTFPVPKLTTKNKEDLTRAAEDILLAREEHFPATIADLYKPDAMHENLLSAHEKNDEIVERIFIGRRFKNDTERLEKLFELYSEMTNRDNNSNQKGTRK